MPITIRLRRDTASNWASADSILGIGETGIETDTRKFKFGDGVTTWNSLLYASGVADFTDLADVPNSYSGEGEKVVAVKLDETGLEFVPAGGGSSVYAGSATLSSGSATVSADWITSGSVIVVTPQAAPSTPGTVLYVDPASIVAATSFDISSDDGSDSRDVFWIATAPSSTALPPLTLPDTFYVSFYAQFLSDEITADDPSPIFELGEIGTSNSIFAMADWNAGGNWKELFIQLNGGSQAYDLTGSPLAPSTYYTFDLKFEFTGGFTSCTVTPRIDGTPLSEGPVTASTGFSTIAAIALGATSGGSNTDKKDIDWLKIGTGTWGDNDLFDADFSAAAPFDSLQGSGISIGSGLLSIDKASAPAAYALKAAMT